MEILLVAIFIYIYIPSFIFTMLILTGSDIPYFYDASKPTRMLMLLIGPITVAVFCILYFWTLIKDAIEPRSSKKE